MHAVYGRTPARVPHAALAAYTACMITAQVRTWAYTACMITDREGGTPARRGQTAAAAGLSSLTAPGRGGSSMRHCMTNSVKYTS
jgi:hypothetical protein